MNTQTSLFGLDGVGESREKRRPGSRNSYGKFDSPMARNSQRDSAIPKEVKAKKENPIAIEDSSKKPYLHDYKQFETQEEDHNHLSGHHPKNEFRSTNHSHSRQRDLGRSP